MEERRAGGSRAEEGHRERRMDSRLYDIERKMKFIAKKVNIASVQLPADEREMATNSKAQKIERMEGFLERMIEQQSRGNQRSGNDKAKSERIVPLTT